MAFAGLTITAAVDRADMRGAKGRSGLARSWTVDCLAAVYDSGWF